MRYILLRIEKEPKETLTYWFKYNSAPVVYIYTLTKWINSLVTASKISKHVTLLTITQLFNHRDSE